jgi:5'-nucleotidase
VVVSGHSHNFTNAYIEKIEKRNGKKILVTQTCGQGEAYGEIDLKIDRDSHEVVDKKAQIKSALMNAGPGLCPDPQVSKLVENAEALAEARIKSMLKRDIKDPIGSAAEDIYKKQKGAVESALGNLVADVQRAAGKTNFAFVNLGSIRADKIAKGRVTWKDLFCVQPFRNKLVRISLKGEQICKLLEQQWADPNKPEFLQISGLSYKYTDNPFKVVELKDDAGDPIEENVVYTATVNKYLAGGGDGFTLLRDLKDIDIVELNVSDFVALVDYIEKNPPLFSSKGRITKIDKRQ